MSNMFESNEELLDYIKRRSELKLENIKKATVFDSGKIISDCFSFMEEIIEVIEIEKKDDMQLLEYIQNN